LATSISRPEYVRKAGISLGCVKSVPYKIIYILQQEEQTPLCWAYEQGNDQIVSLLKHFRRPGNHEDYAKGEFLGGLDTTFFPTPSPKGKLKIVIQGARLGQLGSKIFLVSWIIS